MKPLAIIFQEKWISLKLKSKQNIHSLFFASDTRKRLINFLFYFAILVVLLCISGFYQFDIRTDILATVCAFLISAIFYYMINTAFKSFEDRQKVSYEDRDITAIYGERYLKQFILNDNECCVHYDVCCDFVGDEKGYSITLCDDPSKRFRLDPFIKDHSFDIIKAHHNSNFRNTETVRMDGYTIDRTAQRVYLNTSRSNYIAHMLTNRAVDYLINDELSLRQIYEYRNRLLSFEESPFSNHIGVIGHIMLNDGTTLFPHRSDTSTISKNMITSGLATRHILKNYDTPMTYTQESQDAGKALYHDYIISALPEAMKVKAEWLETLNIEVKLLGIGRDVYEGGKPTCFYLINVDTSKEEYFNASKEFSESRDARLTRVDFNKRVYAVPFDSIHWHREGEFLSFKYYTSARRLRSKCLHPEKNLLCNLYHYIQYQQQN